MPNSSQKTKRSERAAQFRQHGGPGGMSFSQELMASAFALLEASLNERKDPVWREAENHYTRHAPGALVMIVSAFDVWTTEFALGLDPWDAELRSYAERPLCKRFVDLLTRLSSAPSANESALRACVDARDEIVHYLPRTLPDRALPSWIAALDTQGLLIRYPGEQAEFTLSQKLGSYALAHWGFATVVACVAELLAAAPVDLGPFVGSVTAKNLQALQFLPAPHQLAEFDRRNQLTLSTVPAQGSA